MATGLSNEAFLGPFGAAAQGAATGYQGAVSNMVTMARNNAMLRMQAALIGSKVNYNDQRADAVAPGQAQAEMGRGYSIFNSMLKNVQGLDANTQRALLGPIRDSYKLPILLPGEDTVGHTLTATPPPSNGIPGTMPTPGDSYQAVPPGGISLLPNTVLPSSIGPAPRVGLTFGQMPQMPAPGGITVPKMPQLLSPEMSNLIAGFPRPGRPPAPGTPPPMPGVMPNAPASSPGVMPAFAMPPPRNPRVPPMPRPPVETPAQKLLSQGTLGFPKYIQGVNPSQQPGAVTNYNQTFGTSFAVPGTVNGSRPLNYGLKPWQVAALNQAKQTLSQSQDPNATVSFGGKTYSRQAFAQAFPDGTAPTTVAPYAPPPQVQSVINKNDATTTKTTTEQSLIIPRWDLQKYTTQQKLAIQQKALTFKTQGLSDTEAYHKALIGLGLDRIGIAGYAAQNRTGSGKDPVAAIDKEITRISTPTKNLLTGNLNGPSIKDASPDGNTYYMHLLNQRHNLLSGAGTTSGSLPPLTPGMSSGTAIVPGYGRIPVPSVPTLPGFGSPASPFQPTLRPRPQAPTRAKSPSNRYGGLTDAQLKAEYARQSSRR